MLSLMLLLRNRSARESGLGTSVVLSPSGTAVLLHAMRKAINIGLRAVVMLSRFALLFMLARLLAPEDVGMYGLFAASIKYGVMLVGLDFYTYSTRELLGSDRSRWAHHLWNQLIVFGVSWAVAVPLVAILFWIGPLPWSYMGWFVLILVSDHLALEFVRLLVAAGRPIRSNFVLLVRWGVWVWAVIALMLAVPAARGLETVLTGWAVGAAASAVLGLVSLRGLGLGPVDHRLDWPWIKRGLRTASVLFAATLCLHAIFTLDRFMVGAFAGRAFLGVYTFYVGVAMAVISFLDAGVFAFLYPPLVTAARTSRPQAFAHSFRTLAVQTVAVSSALILAAGVLIHPVLSLIGRSIYTEHLSVFYLLLAGIGLYALGMIPHWGLYAKGKDGSLLLSHAVGLAAFLAASVLAARVWVEGAVAVGFVAGFATILLVKWVAFRSSLDQVGAEA